MIIQGFDVSNFRNIEKASLAFSKTFNLITGLNAQGKTNLLEAIHLFSLGRSYRTRKVDEVISFGEEYSFLRLRGRSDSGIEFCIEIGMERGGRFRVTVNGKRLSALSEVIGIIPTVIFTPEDVVLSSGPPHNRRVYIDYTAAQISPAFLSDIKEYRKILKQRNSLLRKSLEEGKDPGELGVWDDMLVEKGTAIVRVREEMLSEIAAVAGELYRDILSCREELRMNYVCSFNPEGRDPADALRWALKRVRESERKRGYTLAGPHFDDIVLYLGSSELRRYGSQGRRRLTSIVLKLAQASIIMDRRAERPVVLLDDIFSELDRETTMRVRALISDRYQSFITSPRSDDFPENLEDAAVFYVEGGSFTRVSGSNGP